jgi:hypothetical protein
MPAGNTFEAIATQTLGSAAASVTFSSIPSTYTDLVLIITPQSSSGTTSVDIQFNGDTGTNYSLTFLYGDGTSAASGRASNNAVANGGTAVATANTLLINTVQIQNYSNTTTYKSLLTRANNTVGNVLTSISMWRNTAAINSVLLKLATGANFTTGSTFSLYGVKNA